MATLIIVESPTKAKAIQSYAGPGHIVKASFGHVRDLPTKDLGVDIEDGFRPHYYITNRKAIQGLKAALERADQVILASDPDREGEAIAWHIAQALRKELRGKRVVRAVFHEITPAAVRAGLAAPRAIDQNLVDAQQARRVLDRLVGYKVSPLLWKGIKRPWVGGRKPPALSAGRVQSVALRLVVERDRVIEAFVPEEYWTLDAELAPIAEAGGSSPVAKPAPPSKATSSQNKPSQAGPSTDGPSPDAPSHDGPPPPSAFRARLVLVAAPKAAAKEPEMLKEPQVQAIIADLEGTGWQVGKVEEKQERRYPYPPFTTSSLQQAASARLSWNPKKTMRVAQELFEGVSIDGQHVGLITYMRTDSTAIAPEAQQAAREIIQKYWPKGLPEKPPVYKTKVANAQEAHEAIRPTDPARTPKALRETLTPDQAKLYEIIWRRLIASQMKPALYHVTTVTIPVKGRSGAVYTFRAVGRRLLDPGFLAVYQAGEDEVERANRRGGARRADSEAAAAAETAEGANGKGDGEPGTGGPVTGESSRAAEDEYGENRLPDLREGQPLRLIRFVPEKHMTEPPRRYTQASLIRELEKRGLGRPSTYASIVDTLLERAYVKAQRGKALESTEVGRQVLDFLLERFSDIFDYTFTARMEEQLDEVAEGGSKWQAVLGAFWQTLGPRV